MHTERIRPIEVLVELIISTLIVLPLLGIGCFVFITQSKSSEVIKLEEITSTSAADPLLEIQPTTKAVETNLGHIKQDKAKTDDLVLIGDIHLNKDAAESFLAMKDAASKQGISIELVSGYRDIATQKSLFDNQVVRKGSVEEASKYSAPPGFSEHHTGKAIDVMDNSRPDAILNLQFEGTQTYFWMTKNAHKYGFRLSFPKDNKQGVSFEPWHWMYTKPTNPTDKD